MTECECGHIEDQHVFRCLAPVNAEGERCPCNEFKADS